MHFDPRLLDLFLEHLPEMRRIAQRHPDEEASPRNEACLEKPLFAPGPSAGLCLAPMSVVTS
jgi:hypothetical protein